MRQWLAALRVGAERQAVEGLTMEKSAAGWMWAFTVKPIWGLLIVRGIKDVENRSFRAMTGNKLVHCGACFSIEEYMSAVDWIGRHVGPDVEVPKFGECMEARGSIIGCVELESALTVSDSRWWDGSRVAWRLVKPRACEPVRASGKLGLWRADAETVARCREARREWIGKHSEVAACNSTAAM